jgi:organic radical activating enzyme
MSTAEAQVVEIFSSIQGEGLYVGERQIFVRFAGCNLSCQYCDTPQALVIPKQFKVERTPGKHDFEQHGNPCSIDRLTSFVDGFSRNKKLNHSVCLTGGEPLLQVDFLKDFLPEMAGRGIKTYLETNGVLPKHLEEVIELVDIISFDIKLPSATGLSSYLEDHKKALEVAALREVFVKIVFTRETKAKEIDEACEIIAGINSEIPLVLQPVTPFGPIKHRPNPDAIMALHAVAKRRLNKVLVIPQVHRIMGQM